MDDNSRFRGYHVGHNGDVTESSRDATCTGHQQRTGNQQQQHRPERTTCSFEGVVVTLLLLGMSYYFGCGYFTPNALHNPTTGSMHLDQDATQAEAVYPTNKKFRVLSNSAEIKLPKLKVDKVLEADKYFPGLHWIYDVAVCPRTGKVFVSGQTWRERVVARFSANMEPEVMYKLDLLLESHFYVSVNGNGDVLLTSPTDYQGQILFISPEGKKVKTIRTHQPIDGCASDETEQVYAAQPYRKLVSVMAGNGYEIRTIGYGILRYPQFVTLDGNRLYVSDYYEKCVFVFDKNSGVLIQRISTPALDKRHLFLPRGIYALKGETLQDLLLITDRDNGYLHTFDEKNGKFVGRFGDSRLYKPAGLARLASGQIAVVLEDSSKILILS